MTHLGDFEVIIVNF